MTPMIEDILVLLFVGAAAVYTVVRLRRVAAGQSNCVCGSKACTSAAGPCECSVKDAAATGQDSELPLVPPACNQGCGGCGKS